MQRASYASSADPEEIPHRFDGSIARTSAATAATRILHRLQRGQRRIVIGPDAWLVDAIFRVAGSRYQRFSRRMGIRQHPGGGDRDGQQVAPH